MAALPPWAGVPHRRDRRCVSRHYARGRRRGKRAGTPWGACRSGPTLRPMPLSLRPARPGDEHGLVAVHEELGDYYAELAPQHFRRPDVDGLAAELAAELREPRADELVLVAEGDGQIVGAVRASLVRPPADAAREVVRDVASVRVRIDYVVRQADRRGQGVGA